MRSNVCTREELDGSCSERPIQTIRDCSLASLTGYRTPVFHDHGLRDSKPCANSPRVKVLVAIRRSFRIMGVGTLPFV